MASVNQEFFDALVRHQIYLLRVEGSIREKIYRLLNKTEADIAEKIRSRLANAKPGLDPGNIKRLQVLQGIISKIRARAWDDIDELWVEELVNLAKSEPEFISGALKTVAPVTLDTIIPSAATLRAIVNSRPFEGRTLKQWASAIRREDIRRIEDAIKIGMVQGETSQQIARRVVGSAKLKGADGVTEITRKGAQAITRTAIIHISNQAKREFYDENRKLFREELYVATLDARTTPICRSLDGKRFPVGEGPIPPLHFNCRSVRVAVIDGQVIGERPAKPVTEQGLVREFAKGREIDGATRRSDIPRGLRGAYDKFARARVRELTGRVDAKVSYQVWLGRQSAAFQDDVLGKTRGALFRRGGLTLDRFVNRAGDEIPLSELARRHRDAFKAAGLDPEDFL